MVDRRNVSAGVGAAAATRAAEQVAVMLFLLSPESSSLTGASYATDGGFTTY